MGVDAEMYVALSREVKEAELKKWSYLFGSAFHNQLFLGIADKIYYHPLEIYVDEYEQVPKSLQNHTIIRVAIGGRYYGPGYERGPIMNYIMMAEFLEAMIPDCNIYYAGDSGGAEEWTLFDKTARKEMLEYFINNNGRDNYIRGFDAEQDGPQCPVCDVKMVRNGWGNNYSLHTCSGCGWQIVKKDGIVTQGFPN